MRILFPLLLSVIQGLLTSDEYECQSPIYCNGTILQTVQQARLFEDSKQFVDMPSKYDEGEIIKRFKKLGGNPSSDTLRQFVRDNFHQPGHELGVVLPKIGMMM